VTRSADVRIRDLMIRWLPLMVSVGVLIFAVDALRQLGVTGIYLLLIAGPASYICAVALTALTPVGRGTIKDGWSMVHDALVMMRLRKASPPVVAG
jgi:hypothetical protein